MRDATVVRPRGAAPAPAAPPPAAQPTTPVVAARSSAARAEAVPPAAISDFLGGGLNALVQAASPLLLLAVQLRNSVSQPDAAHLREQVIAQVRQFESNAQAAGIAAQTITAARYVLCATLDESVMNTPWGQQSGWAAKTLLVVFHGESYGGEKFFIILDRLCADFSKHIDLIELMYICLALGFGGRYQIEADGRAKLADIQEELYRRLKSQRPPAVEELAPHWRGIEDRRNPLVRHVPLWVIVAAAACLLLGAFLYFFTRLNELSSPVSAQVVQIGLKTAVPPDDALRRQAQPPVARKSLKQLLAPEEQAGALTVDEKPDGSALVRLNATAMFASGGTEVTDKQIPMLHAITAALNQVPGRVVVVGHTDDQPVHSLRFKDNYALSAERAKSVLQILSQGIDNAGRLESSGAGSSQPIALPPDLPANRARNRRVEILYSPED
ncbi:type IVB secretion system protein IcmH/DotU [Rhodanobacter sp. AS-Z3]|uniref:type IVB secretion system protein IcmH/DotU n=1 Tax=Rhodanobacter sp. AS-Z3 TaxID=3031330 RepID=UPI00247A3E1E|nr:type IVB secretion system protein IcmH/DotU [Rhodanobacter sp. AS-Z3]WEN16898.1 type IVB secretion system protein IcmH/DotU [Rhodanobacter sp. AS-Z3]